MVCFKVETIKAERDAIESELKSVTIDMKSTFLQALAHDGAINEAELSKDSLSQTYSALQKQVKESIDKQESLLANIQVRRVSYRADMFAGKSIYVFFVGRTKTQSFVRKRVTVWLASIVRTS